MKVAILGCGYVGIALASYLRALRSGFFVTAITRSPNRVSSLEKAVDRVCVVDQGDHEALAAVLAGQDALIIAVAPDSRESYESTYLGTALAVEKALKRLSAPIQILYTSSTSVYGEMGGAVATEETPLSPSNHSGAILIEAENVLLHLSKTIEGTVKTCIFRLGEIVGPGREIAHRLRRMSGTQGCRCPGTGMNTTNIIHVEDIVNAIEFAMKHKLEGVYNLCSDLHIPRKKLYEEICEREGLPPVIWDPTQASMHGGNKCVSSEKIKKAGFRFSHLTDASSYPTSA